MDTAALKATREVAYLREAVKEEVITPEVRNRFLELFNDKEFGYERMCTLNVFSLLDKSNNDLLKLTDRAFKGLIKQFAIQLGKSEFCTTPNEFFISRLS